MEALPDQLFEPLPKNERAPDRLGGPPISFWSDVWRRFRKNRMATIGLVMLAILLLMSVIGPMITPYTYYETNLSNNNRPPSEAHWFGTDDLGRDMFTRTWYGARISLFVGVTAAIVDLIVGVVWGGVAALIGGRTDEIMMRIADVLYGLPYMLTVIMLMVVLGSGLVPIIIAMTIIGWIPMSRIVRGQLLQLRELEYVQAATALGAGFNRILFKHLIPNAMGPIIVTMTLTVPSAIFTEAFLSFLGLGVQAPIASWGTMASDGLPAMKYYPWRLFFPAAFISLTMLAFNLVGDGLRDALDPRLRR
ncbi:MAG: ABC transporter permease [Chlamydiales bacterium]|nr:ABC transporter permease [Chlamydiales bacterium]